MEAQTGKQRRDSECQRVPHRARLALYVHIRDQSPRSPTSTRACVHALSRKGISLGPRPGKSSVPTTALAWLSDESTIKIFDLDQAERSDIATEDTIRGKLTIVYRDEKWATARFAINRAEGPVKRSR